MKNILKQFAVSATNSKGDLFFQARLKLSVFYSAIMLVVLIIFSLAVYGSFVRDIRSNSEYDGPGQEENQIVELRTIDRAKHQLQMNFFLIDGITFIVVIGFSYYFAGKTLKPIESAYKKQKKFVADAAHELRTPLAVMKTGIQAALASPSGVEDYKKISNESLEEINYLSSTVDELLFLAKNDDLKQVEFEKFNLSEFTKKQIEMLDNYAKEKKVVLKNNIQQDIYIFGNRGYIKRLLANLIHNAIDYNKPSGEVFVSLKTNKKQIELNIKDTGIGISKKDLEYIFDRFYKADEARVKKSSGAGLGLSIVKEIVRIHRGKIDITSELGKGTEVFVNLPLIHS